MAENSKQRKAKIVAPPNTLKTKIGSGGIEAILLIRAEKILKNNKVDFRPIAEGLLVDLDAAIQNAKNNPQNDISFIEAMLYPAAQFKSQGALFRFPLVGDISDTLIGFLEGVTAPVAEKALEIIVAHRMAISVLLSNNITGKNHPTGTELKRSLAEALGRYYMTNTP